MSVKIPILPKIVNLNSPASPMSPAPSSPPSNPPIMRPTYVVPPVTPIPMSMPSSSSRPLTPIIPQESYSVARPMSPIIPQESYSVARPMSPISSVSSVARPMTPINSPKNLTIPSLNQIKLNYNYEDNNLFSPEYKILSKIIKKNESGILEYYMTKIVLLNGKTIYLAMDIDEKSIINDINIWKINNVEKIQNSVKNYFVSNIKNLYGYVIESNNNLHVIFYDNKMIHEDTISSDSYYTETQQIYPLYLMSDYKNRIEYIYEHVNEDYKIINNYMLANTVSNHKILAETLSSINLAKLKTDHYSALTRYIEIINKLDDLQKSEQNCEKKTKYAYNSYLKEEKLRELYALNSCINKMNIELNNVSSKISCILGTIENMVSKAPIIEM